MINKIGSLFRKDLSLLIHTLQQSKKTFLRYWVALFTTIIVVYLGTYLTMHFLNIEPKKMVDSFENMSNGKYGNSGDLSYWEGTVHLLKNNWKVCLQVLILSFIPIPFLYNIQLFGSGAILGFVCGIVQKLELDPFQTIVLGVLPHAILELSVFIIATIYASKINRIIIDKILNNFRSNKKDVLSLKEHLKETIIAFVFVITPFIFIAAFVEGYISRFLIS